MPQLILWTLWTQKDQESGQQSLGPPLGDSIELDLNPRNTNRYVPLPPAPEKSYSKKLLPRDKDVCAPRLLVTRLDPQVLIPCP